MPAWTDVVVAASRAGVAGLGAMFIALAGCAAEPRVATPTPVPLQELRQAAVYYASTGSVLREYLATLDKALETGSVDSTMTIFRSLDAGAANLKSLWQYQDNVDAFTLRFASVPAYHEALDVDILMRESFGSAKEGLAALVSGYEKYALNRGFPMREDVEEFARLRARSEALLKRAAEKATLAFEESNRLLHDTLLEVDRADPSGEQRYHIAVDPVVDRFYNHRKVYNSGLERIGAQVRSAKTESAQREALQEAVSHLQDAHGWFRQDRDDFALILPPAPFLEFHLLMNSALNDYVGATAAFVTYYSQNLNLGTQDLQLANKASGLLGTANGNLQRAGYMYVELTTQK